MIDQAFCPHCGAKRPEWARFCAACGNGYDVTPAARQTAIAQTPVTPIPPSAPAVASASVAKKRPAAKIWGWLFVIGAGLWIYGTVSSNHAVSVPQAPAAPAAPKVAGIGDGTFRVGVDIAPGTYRAANPDGSCYWARLSGMGGTLNEIIANDNTTGPAVVTIATTDAAFQSAGCGGWTKP